jgi:hypothetical protein
MEEAYGWKGVWTEVDRLAYIRCMAARSFLVFFFFFPYA